MKSILMQSRSRLSDLNKLNKMLNVDFCPGLNRYVYWLKEPVGWFIVATGASLLVGAFFSPLGWSLAAGLFTILMLGLGFPWLAVRFVRCELAPVVHELHEHEESHLQLSVENRLPIPLWGLMIEGYLTRPIENPVQEMAEVAPGVKPDIGLSSVPPLSTANFRLPIRPEYRGVYPTVVPRVACAFPFGIWTARRPVTSVQPTVVRPLLIPVQDLVDLSGSKQADVGVGSRIGTSGDFLGVRPFRRGDSLRSIHWAQTARNDALVVCERGGPQQQTVSVVLRTTRGAGTPWEARENLAWRVRIAASIVDLLTARHIPFQLTIDEGTAEKSPVEVGLGPALDRLASIPLDPLVSADQDQATTQLTSSCIEVSATSCDHDLLDAKHVRISLSHPATSLRFSAKKTTAIIDLDQDISYQLNLFLREATHVKSVA